MSVKFKTPIDVDGQVSTEYIDLSTTTTHSAGVGEMVWNDTDGTVDIGLKGGNVKLQVGQEQLARVVNKTSPLITLQESNYQVVIITGATGQRLSVKLAQGNNDANSAGTLGVVTETILPNEEGFITTSGVVREINTTGSLQGETWSDGDLLFLSPTVAGAITNIRPVAPNHTVNVGYVEYAHAVHGKIYVKIDNGYELGELHDVDTSESKTTPVDADNLLLQDSADQSVWKKLSWSNLKATLKAYFDTIYQSVLTNPITGTGTSNYVPKFTGSTTLGNSQIFDNGTNVGIGDSNPGYKLTVIGNGYFNDNVLIGNGSQLRFTIPGINIKPELVSSTWSDLSFSTNNSEKMRITSSGNVGIGTTSPNARFTTLTNAAGWAGWIENQDTSGNGSGLVVTGASNSGGISFFVRKQDGTGTFAVLGNGNVGIGTTSPSSLLNVIGDVHLGSYSNSSTVNLENRTSKGIFIISTDGVTNAAGTTITYSWANGGHGPLKFNNASNEVMRLDASGNVGIGTSSPSEKLEVQNGTAGAKIKVSNTGGGYATLECSSNATSVAQLSFTNQLSLIGGNVGIGTTSPGFASFGRTVLSLNGSTNSLMEFKAGDAFKSYFHQSGSYFEIYETSTLMFSVNGSERMRINSSGNVGIGTTTPTSKLTVNDYTAFSWGFPSLASAKIGASGTGGSFIVMTPSLNSSYESGFAVDGTYNSGKSVINLSAFGVYSGGPYSADIAFKTATNTTLSEKMRITNDGNVGIGTTSPSSILHLNSAVPFLSIQGSTTGSLRGINIMQGTTVFSSLSAEASLGETRLSAGFSGWGGFQTFHTNGSEKMRITTDGKVGIGTSGPSVQLNVIGQVIFDDGTLGAISPEPNSILQLESDRKGFLPPRLTETQRNNIGTPVAGLMIFNKDSNYLEVYDGSNWRALAYV